MGGISAADLGEFPMSVSVREIAQSGGPVTSVVRLQPLNCCYMSGIDTSEPSALLPPREALWIVFDRELRTALYAAGVMACKFEDEVIQRTSEVIANLPDQYAHAHRSAKFAAFDDNLQAVGRFLVELDNEGAHLLVGDGGNPCPQVSKMFFCPYYTLQRAIESVGGHAIIPE